ncbi:hypothetical protein [Caryophanon latum]|uniref:Uncharacterized protein n=1 Tax=Caryophanon latum TaxID=33977 RepID=A0A1C0YU94_9BACL|nr:hypothetical protein [Caryophanon latum]OCS90746.1 hypothetical protein A6K76_01465 [Caryophanon latum]
MIQQLHYIQHTKTSILLVEDAYYERFINDCKQYPHYLNLIPETLRDSIHHLNLIRDLYFALRTEQQFLSNPNLSMIYVLRYTLVTELSQLPKFQMLQAICKRTPHVSLLIAIIVATTADEELATLVTDQSEAHIQESFAFINQFPSLDILFLYDEQGDLQNTYPKQLAKAQAVTANLFRSTIREQQQQFQKRLQTIASFTQYYVSLRK